MHYLNPRNLSINPISGFIILMLCYSGLALASSDTPTSLSGTQELDWFTMGMGLFGGLALFLFGMDQMGDALKAAAGSQMKTVLSKLTTNRVMAAGTGALVTAVIQSSSVTTVLVVGFVSAGLMSLSQSIGIIMGANIGTTVTAHIVAFKVTKYALLMVAIGFGMIFGGKTDKIKQYGNIAMGLGLIFYGMGLMSSGMSPLREYQPFIDFMATMENPLLGIMVAAAFTALVQSSSATTGIVIVMATQGFITLPAGIALALGANVGTCVTAMLASIGKPTEAVRAATVHVLFNVIGVMIWVGFIDYLADVAIWVTPGHPELTGMERLAAESPRQIANANTAFNVLNTVFFLFFTGTMAKVVSRIVPERARVTELVVETQYLEKELVDTPSLALNHVRMEIGHMGSHLMQMLEALRPAAKKGNLQALEDIAKAEDRLDLLQTEIVNYLSAVGSKSLSDEEAETIQKLMTITAYLENAGDIVDEEIKPMLEKYINGEVEISNTVREMLRSLTKTVNKSFKKAIQASVEDSEQIAQEVVAMKPEIHQAVDEILHYQTEQMQLSTENQLEQIRHEMNMLDKLRRLYTLAKRIAKESLPRELAMKED